MAKRTTKVADDPATLDLSSIIEQLRPLAVPIEDLVPDPANARKHGAENLTAIKASLRVYGQRKPVVVNKRNGVVEAGNGTLAAAIALKWTHVAAVYVDDDPSTAAGFAIADNRSAELADWDGDALDKLIREIDTGDEDLQEMLSKLAEDEKLPCFAETQEVVEDEVPEPPVDPITKPGDLWLLGEHRLLCGDSTKPDDVARLMAGQRAGLMNTDPPYGVAYANADRPNPGVAKPRVANDAHGGDDLQAFLESAFRPAVAEALLPNAAWYLWHANLTEGFFTAAAAAAAANVVLHRTIIWVKPVLLLGRGQYHWKHEPCFMGWVDKHQPPDYGLGNGERTQTTVWEIGTVTHAERKEFNHSTPKPVGLFTIPIVKHLKPGEICYEPFAGSGPQFIAAEQLGRRCFGMELAAEFCDVIVTRWQNLTGKKAVLESPATAAGVAR